MATDQAASGSGGSLLRCRCRCSAIDDLTTDVIIERLVGDLVRRELTSPDVARDRDLGLLLIDTYVRYPAA
jgi:hypothetical protein